MAGLAGIGIVKILGTVASLAGTAVSAMGTIAAGKQRQASANYQAAQMDIKAKQEHAAAQQEAFQLKRKKKLALSNLQSRAAASGFDPLDPTTQDIAGEISTFGTLREQMAQFAGRDRRQGLEDSAAGAIGTIAGGFGNMFESDLFAQFLKPVGSSTVGAPQNLLQYG